MKFPAAAWFSTVMAPQPVFQELCRFAAGRQLKKPRYVRGVARPPHCRSYTLQPSVNFRWLPAPATRKKTAFRIPERRFFASVAPIVESNFDHPREVADEFDFQSAVGGRPENHPINQSADEFFGFGARDFAP
ncbi:hypothetical protein [Rhodoblastus sp.]|uniref:hypothetical protein n=1 Tax=Rhodoblastus sp. TaxID=1962975 RepID=UPI0026119144|nr:hypothetical protein [Rhodoblastus sp.]